MLGSWRCVRTESLQISQTSTETFRLHKRPALAVYRYSKHVNSNSRALESKARRSLLIVCKAQQGSARQRGKPLSYLNMQNQILPLRSVLLVVKLS